MRVKLNLNSVLGVLAILAVTVSISSPLARSQGRINDKDLETLMHNLKDDAKSFRPVFNSALKKSTIRKTSRQKDADNLAVRFEKETEAMLNRFKNSRKADNELSVVRSTADELDSYVRSLSLGPQTSSRWEKIETELQQISSAFGLPGPSAENPRGVSPYAGNSMTCNQSVGPERAKRLVADCLAVSPATHPPCNAQNSCSLITDEIKRGCSLLEPRNAPAFCGEYR